MSAKIAIVILAAGKGTRMKMDIPKPLVPFHKRTLVDYVLDSVEGLGDIYLITGHQNDLVENHINDTRSSLKANFILQKEQLGTGHAVKTYFEGNSSADDYDYTIVTCADTPLITREVLDELIEKTKDFDGVCATFTAENPTGYGRIVREEKGFFIVEEKDADEVHRQVKEVNSGLYVFKTSYLKDHVFNLKSDNKAGEFYLTDTFSEGANVSPIHFEDRRYFHGVNSLFQLQRAEVFYRGLNAKYLMNEVGVRFLDASHSYIYSNNIGRGTLIHPNVTVDCDSTIGSNVIIEPGCFIENSTIEDGCHIKANTYITDSIVRNDAKVGPMAQLRPGSDIGEGSKLGNFVEVKKSVIGKNTSVSHLSYVGDAEIGNKVNIGCGFITCNYDGANKHKTIIGDGSFIGSDSQMIAPINIGKECYVASGSTINQDLKDGDFAIARGKQTTKEGMARRFIKKK